MSFRARATISKMMYEKKINIQYVYIYIEKQEETNARVHSFADAREKKRERDRMKEQTEAKVMETECDKANQRNREKHRNCHPISAEQLIFFFLYSLHSLCVAFELGLATYVAHRFVVDLMESRASVFILMSIFSNIVLPALFGSLPLCEYMLSLSSSESLSLSCPP